MNRREMHLAHQQAMDAANANDLVTQGSHADALEERLEALEKRVDEDALFTRLVGMLDVGEGVWLEINHERKVVRIQLERQPKPRRSDVTLPVNGHLRRLPAKPMHPDEILQRCGTDPTGMSVIAHWRENRITLVEDADTLNPADELLLRLETVPFSSIPGDAK